MNGNNSQIIRRCFEKRMDYWKEAPFISSVFHFKWQPFSKGIRFEQLSLSQKQMVNHLEYHEEITTKDNLFKNLFIYSESRRCNIFDFVPLTFVLDVDSESYYADLERFVHCYNIIESSKKQGCNKEEEAQILKNINQKLCQIQPTKDKKNVLHCKPKLPDTHYSGNNIWILKPTGFNRGRGVSVFDTLEKLKNLIRFYTEGVLDNGTMEPVANLSKTEKITISDIGDSDHPTFSNLHNLPCVIKSKAFVIQKYIEKPLLVHQRKFDIRVWALVTQEMKLYFFKEGYIRTSCETYELNKNNLDKKNIHLTNNAVQKFCEKYGQFEDGNQLSFPQFQVI